MHYPEGFKQIFPLLIASVCYHWNWIVANFSSNHFIFSTRLVTSGKVQQLRPHVYAGQITNEHTSMVATGVPYYIMLRHENKLLRDKVDYIEALIREKDAAVQEFITNSLEASEDRLIRKILSRLDINGAVQVTQNDLVSTMQNFQTNIMELLARSLERIGTENNTQTNPVAAAEVVDDLNDIWWSNFPFNGNNNNNNSNNNNSSSSSSNSNNNNNN